MEQEIIKLTNDCLSYFQVNCYTQNRIDKYKSMWKHGILSWMQEKKLTVYTAKTGEAFIASFVKPGYVTASERDFIRSVSVLTDFMTLGYVRKKTFLPVIHPLYGAIGVQMQKLVAHLQSLRRSRITISDYELYLNRFLVFLEREGVFTVSGIKERHILKFVSTMENNKINVVSSLRVLFRFWHEHEIIEEKYDELLDHYKWIKREKIPSFYTASEVSIAENSVDRSGGVGKRNYAMMLLASRLGLKCKFKE
jgi:integrase